MSDVLLAYCIFASGMAAGQVLVLHPKPGDKDYGQGPWRECLDALTYILLAPIIQPCVSIYAHLEFHRRERVKLHVAGENEDS